MRTIGAAKFKAQCLSVLDDVENKRQPVLLTKNGRPVAKLVPLEVPQSEDPLARFHYPGGKIVGDITAPLYSDEEWEEFFRASDEQLR